MAADGAGPSSASKAIVRKLWAGGSLVLTMIVIVLALAFGIPWLVGLVWR